MSEITIFQLGLSALVLWVVFKFYWLRVVSCIVLLLAWGSFAIGGPILVAVMKIGEGSLVQALVTLILGVFLGGFWFVAAHAAHKWYSFEKKHGGGFWKPWNTQ
jgi:hypothetical protein